MAELAVHTTKSGLSVVRKKYNILTKQRAGKIRKYPCPSSFSVLPGNPEMSPTARYQCADLLEQTLDKVLEDLKFISEIVCMT